MKKLFAVLLVCMAGTFAVADVPIPKEYRQANRDPGRCAWCALEALGRYHGYKEMEGLVERNARAGYSEWYDEQLKKHKVKYDMAHYTGQKLYRWKIDQWTIDTWDTSWLEWASEKKYGCAVSFWNDDYQSKHMVVLTEFDKNRKRVKIIDSNHPEKVTETYNLSWFLYYWDGSVIIIYPKEKDNAARPKPSN